MHILPHNLQNVLITADMKALKYTAPLIVATLLLAIILIPFLSQARTTDRCIDGDRDTSRSTSTCEVTEPGGDTATSTEPTNDGDDTATSTPSTNDDTTSTSSDDGTDESTRDDTSGGGGSSGGNDTQSAKVSVRDKDGIVVSLDQSFTSGETVSITPTDGNPAVEVASASALALLVALDERSASFSITDLQYYPSFGAFFLNCIKTDGKELCGQWQYTINGNYPSVGLDQYIVDADDSVFLFYGSPRAVEVARQVAVNTEFTATAFEYKTDAEEYQPLSGYTVGVIRENPDNPWSPHEIATAKTNKNGEAVFTINTIGEYKVGLKEDYYSPSTDLEVVETVVSSGGSGSNNNTSDEDGIDIEAAVAFLLARQSANGSFGAPLYSDWAAIALTAAGANETALTNLRVYLKTADGNSTRITDHERRAMALMAAGVSPYNGTKIDHIAAIVASFDGTQIGLVNEVNDDIFALLILLKAGYGPEDEIITKLSEHIAATQNSDGSWGASPDMTAAGIMALTPLKTDTALTARAKARAHLKAAQKDDGGFGNTFSTSWVLMAIAALGETPQQWVKNGTSPLDALAAAQQNDGGFDDMSQPDTNRLWATAYALPAALGKSWLDIVKTSPKPSVLGAETNTEDTEASAPIARTTTSFTPVSVPGMRDGSAAAPAGSTAFRFASDGNAPTAVEKDSLAVSVIEKDNNTGTQLNSVAEEAPHSFFSRFFSKIGSIIFFWR